MVHSIFVGPSNSSRLTPRESKADAPQVKPRVTCARCAPALRHSRESPSEPRHTRTSSVVSIRAALHRDDHELVNCTALARPGRLACQSPCHTFTQASFSWGAENGGGRVQANERNDDEIIVEIQYLLGYFKEPTPVLLIYWWKAPAVAAIGAFVFATGWGRRWFSRVALALFGPALLVRLEALPVPSQWKTIGKSMVGCA